MKFVVQATLGLSLLSVNPAFAATAAPPAQAAAQSPAHVKAVQDLLAAMQAEKTLRGVAARSRYPSEAQRKDVFAKLDRTPPAVIYQRLAAPMTKVISVETASEMTRFYNTPYGKQLIQSKYNSAPQIVMPGAKPVVPPEEKKERKRAAYVKASKELADAQAVLEHEAFKLVQQISKGR